MKKEIYTKQKVSCTYYPEGADVEHCKSCKFFNGIDKASIDCLHPEIPTFDYHITSFTMGGSLYKLREYDEEKEGILNNYCEKCCFNKTLQNGNEVCLLRLGTDTVTCYDDEIWEKIK